MKLLPPLIVQSRLVLLKSRANARRARQMIDGSRLLLSQSGDRVVQSASGVSAARWSSR